MIGPKKLSEIKRELARALRKNKAELDLWVREQIATEPAGKADPKVLEDLLWVQKILQNDLSKKGRRRSHKGVGKNSPAA
ncbi:MAG: hypothetical protein U0793_33310 [Gemmataceae bacterium]